MSDPVEIELKLEVSPHDADRLAEAPLMAHARGANAHLVSTYFDTPELDLHCAGYSLRIRKDGRRRVQTVKADQGGAGLFVRPEWERPISGKKPIIDEKSGPLARTIDKASIERIEQLFLTDVRRTTHLIATADSKFEIALDRGRIRAGPHREQLCEVELELDEGKPGELFDFARLLDEDVPLRLSVRSKAERGYRLVKGIANEVVKAEPIALKGDGSAAEAFCTIARSCIRQFRLNEQILLQNGTPEALHQARVGLRRLRSAFSLFTPLFVGDERAELLRSELRWVAAELGAVRNLDVLVEKADGALGDQLAAARVQTFTHVRTELASARTRLLMIDLTEWLALGDWRMRAPDPALPKRNVQSLASEILENRRKRLKRRGKGLANLPDDKRHKVRIEAKKMRYAAEFFASLYTGKRARRRHKAFLKRIEKLQDHLGDLNDMVVGPRVIAEHAITEAFPFPKAQDKKRLRDKAEDSLDGLIDAKRFWR